METSNGINPELNLTSAIETILFVNGEAITPKKIAKILGVKEADARLAIEGLRMEYRNRGIIILEKDGEYMFGSHPDNSVRVEALIKNEYAEELSKAALETLAVIAYKGPLTRAQIEYMRGVNSSFTVRNLLMRGLIERVDNPQDARSYLYRIGFDFLKHFGLSAIEELPQFSEFKKEEIAVPIEKTDKTENQSPVAEENEPSKNSAPTEHEEEIS